MSNHLIKVALTPGEALLASGLLGSTAITQQAESTARTQIARGAFPFPLCLVPNTKQSRVVLVAEIKRTLRGMQQDTTQEPAVLPNDLPQRRGPGHPRKSVPTITHLTQRTPLASLGAEMTSTLEDHGATHARGSAVALALGGHDVGAEPSSAQCRGPGGAASELSRERAERAPKGPVAKWGAKPPTPAQAGQPGRVDLDDSHDREQSKSGWVARPSAGGAASRGTARSSAETEASAVGSASPSERGGTTHQRAGSGGPQPEHAGSRRPPAQAHEIQTIDARLPGSQVERTGIDLNTDGRF